MGWHATTSVSAGQVFGSWTVLESAVETSIRINGRKIPVKVKCRCECGIERLVDVVSLLQGRSKTCGTHRITHGLSAHSLYPTWVGMINRCHNPNDARFDDWGGRGIYVCDKWRHPVTGHRHSLMTWAVGQVHIIHLNVLTTTGLMHLTTAVGLTISNRLIIGVRDHHIRRSQKGCKKKSKLCALKTISFENAALI